MNEFVATVPDGPLIVPRSPSWIPDLRSAIETVWVKSGLSTTPPSPIEPPEPFQMIPGAFFVSGVPPDGGCGECVGKRLSHKIPPMIRS
jgi:hypothetical protein